MSPRAPGPAWTRALAGPVHARVGLRPRAQGPRPRVPPGGGPAWPRALGNLCPPRPSAAGSGASAPCPPGPPGQLGPGPLETLCPPRPSAAGSGASTGSGGPRVPFRGPRAGTRMAAVVSSVPVWSTSRYQYYQCPSRHKHSRYPHSRGTVLGTTGLGPCTLVTRLGTLLFVYGTHLSVPVSVPVFSLPVSVPVSVPVFSVHQRLREVP